MTALRGAFGKLLEAAFFLKLLERIEGGCSVADTPIDDEATYVAAALLGACFSVIEHARKQGKAALRAAANQDVLARVRALDEEADCIRKRNSLLYRTPSGRGGSVTYGLRHMSVHHEVVQAKTQRRTKGGWGSAMFGEMMWGEVRVIRQLVVDDPDTGEAVWITQRMKEHIVELEAFVKRWEELIGGVNSPGTR